MSPEKVRTQDRREGKAARIKRAEAALIRTVGPVEAILLARDEETARRRASLSLARYDDEGGLVDYAQPEVIAQALGRWHQLRVAV